MSICVTHPPMGPFRSGRWGAPPGATRWPPSLGSGGRSAPRQQRLQVPSDIGGSGGVPRQATVRSSPPARGKGDRGGRRNPRLRRIGFDRETHTLNQSGTLRRTTVR